VNSPIRTSAIGLLQHLQLLYLPSELDIDEQNTTSYLTLLLHAVSVSPCDTNTDQWLTSQLAIEQLGILRRDKPCEVKGVALLIRASDTCTSLLTRLEDTLTL
jgi:hypothetical protein